MKTKTNALCIGAFDIAKGIGMLLVIFAHSTGLFAFEGRDALPFAFSMVDQLFAKPLMPMFFLISGFGLRKRSFSKCVRQQTQIILKPYFITMAVTAVLVFLARMLQSRLLLYPLKEAIKVILTFLVSPSRPVEIWGVGLTSCGPCWFLLALFCGICILNWLESVMPEKYVWIPVFALMYLVNQTRQWVLPFQLTEALNYLPELYVGQQLRKHSDWVLRKKNLVLDALFGAALLIVTYRSTIFIWNNGVSAQGYSFDLLILWIFVFGMIRWFGKLGQFDNRATDLLSFIGRNSLTIMCIHTTEMLALPWYQIVGRLGNSNGWICLLIFLIRVIVDLSVCFLIRNRWDIYDRIFAKKEKV